MITGLLDRHEISPSLPANKKSLKPQKLEKLQEKVFAALALGAIGDTLGFGSGHDLKVGQLHPWELCQNSDYIYTILNRNFQSNYRSIHFKNADLQQTWVVSDDSLLHLKEAEVVAIEFDQGLDSPLRIVAALANGFASLIEMQTTEKRNERWFGPGTCRTHALYKDDPQNWHRYVEYDPGATGCGGAMRGMIFGYRYPGVSNRKELIEVAINAGFLTNPSVIGTFGLLTTAAFTAFALENIPVAQWIEALFAVFEEGESYLRRRLQEGSHSARYQKLLETCLQEGHLSTFTSNWKKFYKMLTNSTACVPAKAVIPTEPAKRDDFFSQVEIAVTGGKSFFRQAPIGDRGDTAPMVAVAALLVGVRYVMDASGCENDSGTFLTPDKLKDLFDRLSTKKKEEVVDAVIHFAIFHGGDNDSTGGIALSLFGTVFGKEGIAKHHLQELEVLPQINAIANKLASITAKMLI